MVGWRAAVAMMMLVVVVVIMLVGIELVERFGGV